MLRWTTLILLLPTMALAGAKEDIAAANSVSNGAYDYYCTGSDGARYELGEVVCLVNNSCSASWLAKCDMSLNNPMWRKVQDGCPAANAQGLHNTPGLPFDTSPIERLSGFARLQAS